MATSYDPAIIQKFADKMYVQARTIVVIYTALLAIIGFGAGSYAAGYGNKMTWALLGTVLLGAIGYYLGELRAFAMRLLAQTALCQMKIEQNTRAGNLVT